MSLFDRVKQRAGVVVAHHNHDIIRSFSADGDPSYSTSFAIVDHEKGLKALCDIMEEELNILKQKMKTVGFLTEEDMKI